MKYLVWLQENSIHLVHALTFSAQPQSSDYLYFPYTDLLIAAPGKMWQTMAK